jgi:uncharacterized glyoxalase superfamily protein PhnB
MIAYEDTAAALEWLAEAFGFRERPESRYTEPDGRISHAEMELGNGLIMLATPTPDYQSPKHHAEVCDAAREWSKVPYVIDGLLVYVDDIDQHYGRAEAAGATLLSGVEDAPYGRLYRAADTEGHRWMFMQPTAGS